MKPRGALLVLALTGGLGVLYLALPIQAGEGVAFPLDDAWIHQTYARSLADLGEWAFVPGQPSAGSTAPLWTLLLAVGYALGVDGVLWSHGLGLLLLALTGLAAGNLSSRLFPGRPGLAVASAAFCAAEWHLAWAAVSGMETLLFIALSLGLLAQAVGPPGRMTRVAVGVLGGLLTLTRPEGVVLLALVAAALAWQRFRAGAWLALLRDGLVVAGLCTLLLAPLVWFNYTANGTPFPNTFSAKQREYAVLLSTPYVLRWLRLAGATLVGPAVLLLPGILVGVARLATREPGTSRALAAHGAPVDAGLPLPARSPGIAWYLPAVWWFVFISLYAWRLPVAYQHGRYVMPSIPVFVVYGLAATASLLSEPARGPLARVLRRTSLALLVVIPLAFTVVGMQAYRDDVTLMNREVVAVARWVDQHTPTEALVAAHDVGALGYFAGRRLVDLAGLVSPDVIPFMGDQEALAQYIAASKADYLVQGLGFQYPLTTDRPGVERVYSTSELWPAGAEHAHMEVFRLK